MDPAAALKPLSLRLAAVLEALVFGAPTPAVVGTAVVLEHLAAASAAHADTASDHLAVECEPHVLSLCDRAADALEAPAAHLGALRIDVARVHGIQTCGKTARI